MNTQEKFDAIMERLHAPEGATMEDIKPKNLTFMVLMGYMDILNKMGMVANTHGITDNGKKFISMCEEFDWKPTDDEILSFVEELIPPDQRSAIFYFLSQLRDNPDGLKEKVQKAKDSTATN